MLQTFKPLQDFVVHDREGFLHDARQLCGTAHPVGILFCSNLPVMACPFEPLKLSRRPRDSIEQLCCKAFTTCCTRLCLQHYYRSEVTVEQEIAL